MTEDTQGYGEAHDDVETSQDAGIETAAHETTTQPDHVSAQIAQLGDTVNQLAQMFQQSIAKPAAPQQTDISDEEIARQLKENPSKGIEMFVAKQVNQRIGAETQQISKVYEQKEYDLKAQSEFPALKSDLAFQKEVAAKMRDLVDRKVISRDHPQLLYMATEHVALRKAASKNSQTTTDTRSSAPSGEAPRGSTPTMTKSSQVTDNDPRVRFAKMIGVKDMDGFKKDLAARDAKGQQPRRR